MSLGSDQRKFTKMVGKLILFAYQQGYELTFGDAFAKTGHVADSFHYKRLAIDLNLFKDGIYLTATADHLFLGEQWVKMGGTWGGNFTDRSGRPNPDGNHYSWGE